MLSMVDGYLIRKDDAREIARAIRQVRNTPRDESGVGVEWLGNSFRRSHVVIPIKNETGSNLEPFSIVRVERGVDSYLGGVGDTGEYKIGRYVWKATSPNSDLTGWYAVLQTGVPSGKIGQAIMMGVTKVRLDDADEGDYASPQNANMTHMKTGGSGQYPVLVVNESGSSDTWGYILLGGSGTGAVTFARYVSQTNNVITAKRYVAGGGVESGTISVKTTIARDVGGRAAFDLDDFVPQFQSNDSIVIAKDLDGDWQLVNTLIPIGDAGAGGNSIGWETSGGVSRMLAQYID